MNIKFSPEKVPGVFQTMDSLYDQSIGWSKYQKTKKLKTKTSEMISNVHEENKQNKCTMCKAVFSRKKKLGLTSKNALE